MTVRLTSSDGFTFPAYVAKPDGAVKGAVVVLQEIFGVNAHIREVADGYAKQGYLAVAPATFHRVKPGVELGYTPDDMQHGMALKPLSKHYPRRASWPIFKRRWTTQRKPVAAKWASWVIAGAVC